MSALGEFLFEVVFEGIAETVSMIWPGKRKRKPREKRGRADRRKRKED